MAVSIGMILQDWANLGVFDYALPFLLIFALVFAILLKINIVGSKDRDYRALYAIIAMAISLLALQYNHVPLFFSIIFPKVGIALSILLTAIILMGLFAPYDTFMGPAKLFLGIGGVAALVVVITSFDDYSWWTGGFWQRNLSAIVAGLIIIVFVAIVVGAGKKESERTFWHALPSK
ncbi:MAG: hypothetical protein QXJ28_01500 [Candidatus Pacearchaeota archaeon]